jgi:nucleoid DNA-binding protein
MIPNKVDIILEEVSKKHNLPKQVIEEIYKSQFYMLRNSIKEGEFKNVMLNMFGKFYVNPVRLEIITKLRNEKRSKIEE